MEVRVGTVLAVVRLTKVAEEGARVVRVVVVILA